MKKINKDIPQRLIPPQICVSKSRRGGDIQKFYVKTFGCQMNIADSDSMGKLLLGRGYLPAEKPENADIIIINTCTVRQHAEDRALSYLGETRKLKKKNPKLKIFIAGCVASRLKEDLKKRFSYLDGFIPANDTVKLLQLLETSKSSNTGKCENLSEFVTITLGCSNFCSYCIVPFVRGPEKSRSLDDILSDIKMLTDMGKQEITLLGQNVNSYKFHKMDFADLLLKVEEIPEIKKIKFMTSHPKDMSNKIIDAIDDCGKVVRQIHLPVQSGSDRILKLMNRKYTVKKYMSIIEKMQKKIKDVSFTTDIIVGFPTETEKDFNDTLKLVKKVKFASAFTFKYSPRENTKAYAMEDDVPLEVKKKRLAKLNSIFYDR
ncbi:MAG: tRNA (N6-isopentenyl adenosine(37)-C2)-methylthiotransferase MiaB [Elusimicrobia bacterium]|nr:tRNA (N6-isopentenyl adenosine(37)-C2)-methylthiotransferase MiaB [Elusimicrobiota bacterium]